VPVAEAAVVRCVFVHHDDPSFSGTASASTLPATPLADEVCIGSRRRPTERPASQVLSGWDTARRMGGSRQPKVDNQA
jgi:hypothetical protein